MALDYRQNFDFRWIFWEGIKELNQILHNASMLTRSIKVFKHKFSQIYNTVYCQNFISTKYLNEIWPSFAYALMLTRSRLELLLLNFRRFTTQLWPWVIVKILFPLNILGMNWWNLTSFYIFILPDLDWNCYTWIFANLQQIYGP